MAVESFTYKQEVFRKMIHLSSLWMPMIIYLWEKRLCLIVFSALIGITFSYEVIRRQKNKLANMLERLLGAVLRPEERGARFRPSGAVYVLLAAFLSTLFFPTIIAVTAMAMMLTGDVAAALVGRKFGRIKILDKSLEGAAAFFITAFLMAAVIATIASPEEGYLEASAVAAVIAAGIELISRKLHMDDNLSVPLAAGFTLMLVM